MILRPRQTQLVERAMAALHQHGNTLAVAPTGCHALDTPILMFDGTVKAVQNIAVGDQLMGPDSTPRRVLELHRGQDEMFEIRPMKGESFVVNAGHILTLVRTNDGKSKGAGQLIDIALQDYLTALPDAELFRVAVDTSTAGEVVITERTGFTVHPVGRDHYYGFSVDGDQRYVMGDFTVTHNSGKTIMLSALAGKILTEPDAKACILAHRTELTSQNRSKFERVNPKLATSVYDANEKSWAGSATFAMVQTLSRQSNLSQIPTLDLLVVDEAHHCASPSYRAVIEAAQKKNPKLLLAGLTATPNRGDGKGLREVFSNVADQITLGEMIAAGHLVPPRTFVIDVGAQEALGKVRRTADDFDMREVASILNSQVINDAVVTHWKEKAGGRKTIVFCSTVAHADDVCRAFNAAGVYAVLIHGELSDTDRKERLAEYETGKAQVVVNVAVLTEGYDYTPTSCVVLLRPSSYKSTLIQMIGRGLRTVDPEEFPGVVKTDCVVLDFGTATLMHGNLEQTAVLDGAPVGDAKHKTCPECEAQVPLAAHACALCGYEWPRDEPEEREGKARDPLDTFVMSEIDLLSRSNFLWCDLFGQDDTLMATGFNAWGGVFFLAGHWYAVGGGKGLQTRLLNMGDRTLCLARADDWLNEHENEDAAHKTRRWVNQPATDKQMQYLPPELRMDFDLSRYQASVHMSFVFNKKRIQTLVMQAAKSAALREVA